MSWGPAYLFVKGDVFGCRCWSNRIPSDKFERWKHLFVFLDRLHVTLDQGWLRRTLIPPMCKERMVNSMTISLDGKFKCVDDVDLSAVLRS